MSCIKSCFVPFIALALLAACQAQAGMQVLKSGDNYKVMAEVKPGSQKLAGKLIVVIEPTGGWKMEREKGPAGFSLEVPEEIKLASKKFKKSDAKWDKDGKRIRFEVPYSLAKAGEHKLQFKFRFVICTDKLCQMKRFAVDYSLKG